MVKTVPTEIKIRFNKMGPCLSEAVERHTRRMGRSHCSERGQGDKKEECEGKGFGRKVED